MQQVSSKFRGLYADAFFLLESRLSSHGKPSRAEPSRLGSVGGSSGGRRVQCATRSPLI